MGDNTPRKGMESKHPTTNFTRRIESFVCQNCGATVDGNGYTNHCPRCLWSKHVDVTPGDRASTCSGGMEPVTVAQEHGEYIITHRCTSCGHEKRNRRAADDDFEALVRIARGGQGN